jgi:phage/plasmid-associated DNA primase
MAENNDSVRYFMSHEKDIKVGQGSVNATELYTTYRVFCQSSGTKYAVGFRTFCRRLEDLAGEIGFTAVVSGIDMTLEGLHIHAS